MKILIVPKEFPHSKVIGGPIIIYNRIKYLAKHGHDVGVVSFIHEKDRAYLPSIEPFLKEIELLPYPKKRGFWKKVKDWLFSDVPPYMCNTKSLEMYKAVGKMVERTDYDIVIAEYTVMGQYLYKNEYLPDTAKRIISCHECYYNSRKRAWELNKWTKFGFKALLNQRKLKKYEFNMYRSSHRTLTLTLQERELLLSYASDLNISVVPHGVDVEFFKSSTKPDSKENSIMFLGNYPHEPNRDAINYFYDNCWQELKEKIPDIKFYVVGRFPTEEIIEMGKTDKNIIVTGTVDDVREYFEKAKVFICPVRMGTGFRGKILEAMAMGLPIVSSELGAHGIPIKNRENVIIAEEPSEIVNSITELLENAELFEKIRLNGRKLVEEKYAWEKGVETLEEVFQDTISSNK